VQVDSRKESLPGWRMGTSNRFKYADIEAAAEMPGAGQYRATTAVGKQALSNKKSLPTVKFGTSTRDAAKKVGAGGRPGAGARTGAGSEPPAACALCCAAPPVGCLPPAASPHAAAPARPQTFISKEHEKQSFGELSPGPGTASPKSSLGRQLLSVKSSSPGWGFGSSQVGGGGGGGGGGPGGGGVGGGGGGGWPRLPDARDPCAPP
jgi:hypothetical protein